MQGSSRRRRAGGGRRAAGARGHGRAARCNCHALMVPPSSPMAAGVAGRSRCAGPVWAGRLAPRRKLVARAVGRPGAALAVEMTASGRECGARRAGQPLIACSPSTLAVATGSPAVAAAPVMLPAPPQALGPRPESPLGRAVPAPAAPGRGPTAAAPHRGVAMQAKPGKSGDGAPSPPPSPQEAPKPADNGAAALQRVAPIPVVKRDDGAGAALGGVCG